MRRTCKQNWICINISFWLYWWSDKVLHHVFQCYLVLHSVLLCFEMLLNSNVAHAQYYVVLRSVTKCYPVLRNVTQCYEVLRNVAQCYAVLSSVRQRYAVLSSVIQCYAVLRSVMKCYPVFCFVTRQKNGKTSVVFSYCLQPTCTLKVPKDEALDLLFLASHSAFLYLVHMQRPFSCPAIVEAKLSFVPVNTPNTK